MAMQIKVPKGLIKCKVCGEYNGEALWGELSAKHHLANDYEYFSVSCLCKGILCHRCKKNMINRPISNTYEEETNSIWHIPSFTGMRPCKECLKEIKKLMK